MRDLRFTKSLKKVVGIAGVAGLSTLLGLPVLAQQTTTDSVDSTPSVCVPRADQGMSSQSPTGGATMEQMQANNSQSMNQSNIGTSTYYGQSLPDGSRVSASAQVSTPPAGGSTAEYMQGSSSDRQVNYLSRSNADNNQSSNFRISETTPTNGPAGGYTMERFRAMSGNGAVNSASNYNNYRAYNYNSGYRADAAMGPAGGYSAGMVGSNNQSSYNTSYNSQSMNSGPMPGSMSSDQNRPATELAPETSSSSRTYQSRSIYRVGPSSDSSSVNNTNQSLTTGPMAGSMSSDRNRPAGEISPEASERVSQAIGGC